MQDWIDPTLYPDREPPSEITTFEERMEFLHLMCAAWDFGIPPAKETIREIRRPEWTAVVDALRYENSVSYHLIRDWHGLPPIPYAGQYDPEVLDDPCLGVLI